MDRTSPGLPYMEGYCQESKDSTGVAVQKKKKKNFCPINSQPIN